MKRFCRAARTFDVFLLLFVVFIAILLSLAFYLNLIDKNVRNFTQYYQNVQRLDYIERRIDRTLHEPFHFVDYDTFNRQIDSFTNILASLHRSDLEKEFGERFGSVLKNIDKDLKRAYVLLEDFKTYNARITATVHNLYELRRLLEAKENSNPYTDNIFFSITRLLMDMPLDETYLRNNLKALASMRKNKVQRSFYIYAKNFLNDVKKIEHVIKTYDALSLNSEIERLRLLLEKSYIRSRDIQRDIALVFFVFGIFILFVLLINYRNLKKTTLELQAFRGAIENSDNAIVITDKHRRIEYVNEAFERLTGYTKEEVLGKRPDILKSGLTPENIYRELNKTLANGKKWEGELVNRRKDGTLLYEKASIVPIRIDERVIKYLAVKLDITEYKAQVLELKRAAAVYESLTDGIIVTDKNKNITSINPAVKELLGYEEKDLIGKSIETIALFYQDETPMPIPWERIERNGKWSSKVYKKTKNGKKVPVWLTMIVVRDEKEEIRNYIAIDTDLKEIFKMQKRLERYAYYDRLTKLPNRIFFESNLKNYLRAAEREEKKAALLFADLDRFKVINDTLGHNVGDKMLKKVAFRFRKLLGENILIARMGGDEFVVLVEFRDNLDEVRIKAEAMLQALREPFRIDGFSLSTTTSIGIAIYPDDTRQTRELVRFADAAMYDAKARGKNTYRFYTQILSKEATQRLHIEQELRFALKRNELFLVFQPQYHLATGKFEAVEALLRWKNKKLGIVRPDLFIPIAEETGMIVDIGKWVIDEACKAMKRWNKKDVNIKRISVNVSTVQFAQEDVYRTFEECIEEHEIQPSSVEIEITERLIMEYSETNLQTLDSLRKLGCRIAIDDFGTGYSSLSYMKKMAIDTIKIDKSFIGELPHNPHDAEVTRAIVALSKSLGYEVIAEGVETKEQESFLKALGCDLAQGYLYAKPLSVEELEEFLKAKES
jgi:diguanylate cyclase (GGDEF)-like protein/PAS domain S-box-containing protein